MTKKWSLWLVAGLLFVAASLSQVFMYPPFTEVKWGIFAIALFCVSLLAAPLLKGWTGLISVIGICVSLCVGLGVLLGMNRERGSWVFTAAVATTIIALIALGVFPVRKNFGALLTLLAITCLAGACVSVFLVAGFGFYPRSSYSGVPDLPALVAIFAFSFISALWVSYRLLFHEHASSQESVLLGVLRSPLILFIPNRFVQ